MVVTDLTFIEEAVSHLKTWRWEDFKRQMEGQKSISPMPKSRRNLSRRPNACLPCQRSKVKCDGRLPSCTACTKKRPKSQSLCVYPSQLPRRRPAISQTEADQDSDSADSQSEQLSDHEIKKAPHRGPPCVVEEDLFGVHSMAQCIDQFKQLSGSPKSMTYPSSVLDCTGMEAFELTTSESIAVESAKDKSNNIRLTPLCPYSLSTTLIQSMPSYLKTLYDDVTQLQGMIRMGKLMNAWIDMPRLVRVAEIARLNQDEGSSTPQSDPQESEYRRRVWWMILELDVQISMHVGRPLAAQVKLGIDRPTLNGVEGIYKSLEQSKLDFTQYALEVLNELCTYEDQTGDRTYESLVELTKLDRLQRMEKRLPQIPKDLEYDEQLVVAVCDYKIELLSLKMMLCCTLAKAAQKQRGSFSVFRKDSHREQKKSGAAKVGKPRATHIDEAYPHQTGILESARAILESFTKVAAIDTYDQYANWNRFFDAFCATAILATAHLRQETKLMSDVSIVRTMSRQLQAISNRNPHCRIATVAIGRIGQLLDDIEKDVAASATEQQSIVEQSAPSGSKPKRLHSENDSSTTKPQDEPSAKKRKTGDPRPSSPAGTKRRKRDADLPKQEPPQVEVAETAMMYPQYMGTAVASQGHDSTGYSAFANDPGSLAAAFDTSTGIAYDPSFGTYGDQIALNNATSTSWYWIHPPFAQPQPPLRAFDEWPVPPYTTSDDWQQPTVSYYQSNIIPEQAAQGRGAHEPGPFYDRGSISASVPPTPVQQQPASTNQYYADLQPSLAQTQIAAGTGQSGQDVQNAVQEDSPWDWVQHQQNLIRRNSAMAAQTVGAANEAMYQSQPEYFQASDIPTTSGAWA